MQSERRRPIARVCERSLLIGGCIGALGYATALAATSPLPVPNVEILDGGTVEAIARGPDGSTYIGGAFTSVFDPGLGIAVPRLGLAKFAPDGTLDYGWDVSIEEGLVYAIDVDANGDVYIGGSFMRVDMFTRRGLVKLSGTTGQQAPWLASTNCSFGVECITAIEVDDVGSVYVGGAFTTIVGQSRNGLAKLSTANGAVDATWNPDPTLTGAVLDLEIGADDSLFVAGSFSAIGGAARAGLAKLSRSGAGDADATWDPSPAGGVSAMTIVGGTLYVGGSFSAIGGQTRGGLAKLSTAGTGAADATWNPGIAGSPTFPLVNALRGDGSAVYVAGVFTTVGGLARANLAKLSASGTGAADAAFDAAPDRDVNDIVLDGSGGLQAAGEFRAMRGASTLGLARLSAPSGDLIEPAFVQGLGFVFAIARDADGNLYVGGRFARVAGQNRRDLVKLRPDGTVDPDWNPAPSGAVRTLVADGTGSIYAGGSFRAIGGAARDRVAKLASAGTGVVEATWNPAANGSVGVLALDAGTLYLGGGFTTIGGVTRNGVARVAAASGALDPTWNPSVSGGDISAKSVYAIVPDPGGWVYLGGQFGTVGGLPRSNVARVSAAGAGAPDATWNPGASSGLGGSAVNAMVRRSDGSIVIGGFFSTAGGRPRNNLALLSGTGTGDAFPAWDPSPDNTVWSLAAGPGNTLFVGGDFLAIDFGFRNHIAKLTPGGFDDFEFDATANSTVFALTTEADGNVYVGGFFTRIGGENRQHLAAFTAVTDPIFASGFE